MDELVSPTVINHIGKKYITAKLQFATKKFCMPMRTGIFCFRRKGASTGSGAIRSSTYMNAREKMNARDRGR